MKARSFPKLDRPSRHKPEPAPSILTAVDEKTWKAWRMKLGASRKEANELWSQYLEWLDQKASTTRVRVLRVRPWQNWEREFRAFLDEMPRKPFRFLAMVADAEKRRAQRAMLAERKARGRDRYLRQFNRRGSS